MRRFIILLRGLSSESLFRHAIRNRPREIDGDKAASQAISRM